MLRWICACLQVEEVTIEFNAKISSITKSATQENAQAAVAGVLR
jgi:hypothetical protein